MKADDRVVISDLLWQLATKAADENPQYWKDGSDSEDAGRSVHAALSAMNPEHAEALAPEIEPLLPHIIAMLHDGTITAHSTFNGVRPVDVDKVAKHPTAYWLTTDDADKVRTRFGHSATTTGGALPQNGEPGKARLTVEIDGHQAIPVRAIPFITKWRLAPDDLARKLAGRANPDFPGLEKLVAHHLVEGKPLATEPRDWVGVSDRLEAFKTNLREKYPNPNADDRRGSDGWRQESPGMLPADCFVWRAEFDPAYRAYRPDDLQGPNYAPPMLTDEELGMIWEGFNVSAQDIAEMAEFANNDCSIDWEFWVGKMPRWTAGQAARLMAGLEPSSFPDLSMRRNEIAGIAKERARRFEQLAAAHRMTEATPAEWLQWVDRLCEPVHTGLRIALENMSLTFLAPSTIEFANAGGVAQPHQGDVVDGGYVVYQSAKRESDAPTVGTGARRALATEDQNGGVIGPSPMPSRLVASAFGDLNGWDDKEWARNLGDPPEWLKKARVTPGRRGRGGAATWNPVIIALALADMSCARHKLNAVFKNPSMKAWVSEWEQKSEMLRYTAEKYGC